MDQTDLLNYLLHQKPEDIREWIQGSMDSSMLAPENFNWLGLAQGATSKAESLASSKPEFLVQAIQWARVGVMIYEYLLNEKSNLYDRNSLENSLMMLRTFFIVKIGIVDHDSLLDVNLIIQWFFLDLPYSLRELAELSEIWREIKKQPALFRQLASGEKITMAQRELQAEMFKQMRWIKNKLKILKILSENKCLSPSQDSELRGWIRLWEQLP